MSRKHLDRSVNEFAGRHNLRELDTIQQMCTLAAAMPGKQLRYKSLVKGNGLSSGARETAACVAALAPAPRCPGTTSLAGAASTRTA